MEYIVMAEHVTLEGRKAPCKSWHAIVHTLRRPEYEWNFVLLRRFISCGVSMEKTAVFTQRFPMVGDVYHEGAVVSENLDDLVYHMICIEDRVIVGIRQLLWRIVAWIIA